MSRRVCLLIIASVGAGCSQQAAQPGVSATQTAPSSAAMPISGTTASTAGKPASTAAATSGSGAKPAGSAAMTVPMQAAANAGTSAAGQSSATAGTGPAAAAGSSAAGNSAAGTGATAAGGCEPRTLMPSTGVHFHHVHFNTVDPEMDLAFYEKYFSAMAVPFCNDKDKKPLTKASQTERGWFLYSKVEKAPDNELNTYLEHVGWIHQDPAAELMRLVALGVPRYPAGGAQCDTAFEGTAPCLGYWFYLLAPSGARIEVALGPGPATMGYGHVHFVMGEDYTFFEKFTDGAMKDMVIDGVNHTNAALDEAMLMGKMVVDTKNKPIDHIGYSTANLEAERDRIKAAGIAIEEDISFKPEFGFRSFFAKSPKGTWVEMVEDSKFDFAPP